MAQSTDPVRVLHVTDPHLFAEAAGDLRGTVTLASLQKVLDHFQGSGWAADFVAATGDLIQDDSAAAYERFCDLLQKLNLPVHCLPGNHDIHDTMQKALRRPGFHYCESLEIGSWLVVNIDSCVADSAGGRISESELRRLGDVLEKSAQPNCLVCLHHPPVDVGSKWLDSVGLANASEFLDLISSYPTVRGAIFGHAHQEFDDVVNGIHIIGTPSTCRQFKPGSEDFALDDNPPAYRRIKLRGDGSIDSELIWVA